MGDAEQQQQRRRNPARNARAPRTEGDESGVVFPAGWLGAVLGRQGRGWAPN